MVKKHHLLITLEASEALKKQISLDIEKEAEDEVKKEAKKGAEELIKKDLIKKDLIKLVGKDLISQKAKTLNISNQELVATIKPVIKDYLFLIERLLEEMPNALLSDVLDRGLLLSGNLAKLNGLDRFLAQSLKMPVALVDDPDLAAATGALTVLENLDLFKASLAYA